MHHLGESRILLCKVQQLGLTTHVSEQLQSPSFSMMDRVTKLCILEVCRNDITYDIKYDIKSNMISWGSRQTKMRSLTIQQVWHALAVSLSYLWGVVRISCQDGDTCGVVQASSKNVVEPCRNTKFRRCGWVLLLRGSFVCPAGVRIWLQVVIPERREDEFVLPGRRGLTRNPGASTWCMCLESVPPPLKRELP